MRASENLSDSRHNVPTMDDPRIAEARHLRATTRMSLAELRRHFRVGKDALTTWLAGVPVPEWTRRPRAKDDVRDRVVELRKQGWSLLELAAEFGVSKSSVYLWTKDTPSIPMTNG